MSKKTFCGYVAIIGRPNVGKSTLLNNLVGEKVSITSRKPQTTRHQIRGIETKDNIQIVYVDTPGMHIKEKHVINRYMNKLANYAIDDVDIIVFIVDASKWHEEDEFVLQKIQKATCPVFLVINKVDKIKEKERLLPIIKTLSTKGKFTGVFQLSAKQGTNVEALEQRIIELLPESPHFFDEDQFTDRSTKFMAAELIREKLFRTISQEVPYALAVEIESFKVKKNACYIAALIFVEKAGQKNIVIGKKGEKLKQIGIQARCDIEKLLGQKVYLELWVKVKDAWSDDERMLKSLGYED